MSFAFDVDSLEWFTGNQLPQCALFSEYDDCIILLSQIFYKKMVKIDADTMNSTLTGSMRNGIALLCRSGQQVVVQLNIFINGNVCTECRAVFHGPA